MAGDDGIAHWIAEKLKGDGRLSAVRPIGSGFLEVVRKDGTPFTAAAIGINQVITGQHVAPLFQISGLRPEFVVNVPSKAIWRGDAIDLIHNQPAAFGTLGELTKASYEDRASSYRNKEYKFFDQAFRQHSSVTGLTRVYDKVFQLHRTRDLPDLVVVLVDAYDMSAEDVRNARDTYGKFDAAVKMSSYGSVTTAAKDTAESIGAGAFKFGELLARINRK